MTSKNLLHWPECIWPRSHLPPMSTYPSSTLLSHNKELFPCLRFKKNGTLESGECGGEGEVHDV